MPWEKKLVSDIENATGITTISTGLAVVNALKIMRIKIFGLLSLIMRIKIFGL